MNPAELRVIVVDPSIRATGVYVRTKSERQGYRIRAAKMPVEQAFATVYMKLFKLCARYHPIDLALVESLPIGVKRERTAVELAGAFGVVRAVFGAFRYPVVEVHPSVWQSLTTGRMDKGTRAKDAAYTEEVARRYGVKFESTDVADAYLIYRAGMLLLQSPGRTDAQRNLRNALIVALNTHERSST